MDRKLTKKIENDENIIYFSLECDESTVLSATFVTFLNDIKKFKVELMLPQ